MRRLIAACLPTDPAPSRNAAIKALVTGASVLWALGAPIGAGAAVPNADGEIYHTRFKPDGGEGIREVEIEGRIRFSADESRIEWMGDGAYLHLVADDAGQTISFSAEPDAQGRPVVRYAIGGQAHAFDPDAQRRLAGTMPVVFRELGHDAATRVQAAYQQGGAAAVLGMIATIRSDYAARLHYVAFLDLEGLTDDEIDGALKHLGHDIDSDSELATALYAAAGLYRERPGIRRSYLDCLAHFGSEVERTRITHNLFGMDTIPGDAAPEMTTPAGDC